MKNTNKVIDFKTVQSHRAKKDVERFLKKYNKPLKLAQDLVWECLNNEEVTPVDVSSDNERTDVLVSFKDLLKKNHILPLLIVYEEDGVSKNRTCFLVDIDVEDRTIHTISTETDKVRLEDILGQGVETIKNLGLLIPGIPGFQLVK